MSMLEEEYPSETWVRVYTEGSATNVTTKRGAGIYIKYPNGDQQYQRQYQQAYIVQTTKLKKKPLLMLHTPSKTKSITQPK